jgi:HK97 gp10 family phage protein
MADTAALRAAIDRAVAVARKAGYAAVLKEAREIAQAIRRAAPRGTGKLQQSVRLETVEAKSRVLIKAGGAATTRMEGGKPYDYSLGTEWGTAKTPAQPFFYPMWRLHRGPARRRIKKAMKDAVETAFARSG